MNKTMKKICSVVSVIFALILIFGAVYFCVINKDVFSPYYTVSFDAGDIVLEDDEIKLSKNNCVTLPVLSKEGYTFDGWFNGDEKWESNMPVKSNMKLVAKFTPLKFKITFVVDDEEFEVMSNYDSIPEFPLGVPTKQPTDTKEYVFIGYNPELEIVKSEARYEALFEERTRHFEINLSSSLEGCCDFVYDKSVALGDGVEISVTPKNGYKFLGWFDGDNPFTENYQNLSLTILNVTKDISLNAKFELIEFEIFYVVEDGIENNNITKYDVTMGDVGLIDLNLSGHTFKGWFTSPNGEGEKVEKLNFDVVSRFTTFYAFFNQKVKVSLMVDGTELASDEISVFIGEKANVPSVDTKKYGMSAYKIDGWYTTSACETKFDFTKQINEDVTIFGTWTYILDSGFYEYKTKFDNALKNKSLLIESEEELIKWVEYVEFNNIVSSGYNAIKLKYGSSQTAFKVEKDSVEELRKYVNNLFDKSEFPSVGSISYGYVTTSGKTKLSYICLSSDTTNTQASKTADPTKSGVSEQYEFAFVEDAKNSRGEDFDDFRINKVKKEISVSSSSQLVYVLEKGLKPVPVKGSNAELVYNKAKSVLRNICDDSMTDFEKIKAIYDWLILNVQYDKVAASSESITSDWVSYDAWYPEGVFLNHKAVCDGLARSLLIMARIENIGAIRVSGYHNGGGHAWNKVYINGKWYGIDATHGNLDVNGSYEILTYSSFLFTDEFKSKCCTFEIKEGTNTPTTSLNVYSKISFGTGSQYFDLYLNSVSELNNFVIFVKNYEGNASFYEGTTNHNYFTIEVAIASDSGISVSLLCSKLGVYSYVSQSANGNIMAYSFVIKF